MWVFDSSNEASGCTGYNAKNPNTLNCTVAEKIWKNHKNRSFFNTNFSATVHCKELRFLRCNQCIQTLHLSYQKHPNTMILIFWVIIGFYNFSDPSYWGQNVIFFSLTIFSVFLWNKAYKTNQSRKSVGIVSPPYLGDIQIHALEVFGIYIVVLRITKERV